MQLFQVKPEYTYGNEKDEKRPKQLALLESLGLKESEDGRAYCTAEQALTLLKGGYCGTSYIDQSNLPVPVWSGGATLETMFNDKCKVAQPSTPLFEVRRLMLIEDACTDAVQSAISQGWHILAIQPQPDQRRSDYVMGRCDGPPYSAERG